MKDSNDPVYFVLKCFGPSTAERLAQLVYRRDHPRRSWASGKRFSDNPAAAPFSRPPAEPLVVQFERGSEGGALLEFWEFPVPLMSKRLLGALREAGVANLDTYRAEIRDDQRGKVIKDYVAFNVCGVISAADAARSIVDRTIPDRMISMEFDSLAIDPSAARGELLFRLAESVNAIIVHRRVKTFLENAGFDTLSFLLPEEWAG